MFGDLVLTHDMMIAGLHWPVDADPADVAWKLVGVNLSDLAAKGAVPLGVLLGFMLGDDAWDLAFAGALGDALSHYETELWGGDTVGAPSSDTPRSIGLTAIGRACHMPVPSRSGAQVGDAVWVTGTIGEAMLGFEQRRGAGEAAWLRFCRPEPRLAEGRALAPLVTAMMDVSDGLLIDAQRLAMASGVTIAIGSSAVPLPAATAGDAALADRAMRWGDDYELLFTLPDAVTAPVAATRIGTVLPVGPAVLLIDGQPADASRPLGFQHHGE